MKAKDLMIGDWVARVFSAINGRRPYSERPLRCDLELINHLFTGSQPECGIVPIPLTEDILKANGFEYDDDGALEYFIDDTRHINIDTNEKEVFICHGKYICGIHLQFVHELQHALRLCGLNELADNFQVK